MEVVRYILIFLLMQARMVSMVLLAIIFTYLRKKTLAMHTIFDDMIQDLILGGIACGTLTDFATIGFGPLPLSIAIFIYCSQILTVQFWFMQIFSTFLIRYLYIFHFNLINMFKDEVIHLVSRTFCLLWAIYSLTYEVMSEDVYQNDYVQNMAYDNKVSLEEEYHNDVTMTKIVVFLNIVFIAFVYIRIEMYKWQFLPSGSYSKTTMRATLALFLSLSIRLFFPMSFKGTGLLHHLIFTFVLFVFLPVLMIVKNDQMMNYATTIMFWSKNSVSPLPH